MTRRLVISALAICFNFAAVFAANAQTVTYSSMIVVPPPGSAAHAIVNLSVSGNNPLGISYVHSTAILTEQGAVIDTQHSPPCFAIPPSYNIPSCNSSAHTYSAVSGWKYCVEGFIYYYRLPLLTQNIPETPKPRCKVKP
jgi:hypothetical protein